MQPPAKKMRMSRSDDLDMDPYRSDEIRQLNLPLAPAQSSEQTSFLFPTPTIDLSEFRPRSVFLNNNGGPRKRGGPTYLMPRAPDVTITASIINVAIVDGDSATETTQVTAATSDSILSIGNKGVLTVPAVTDIMNVLEPAVAEPTQSSTSSSFTVGDSLTITSASVNSTSSTISSEHTVTLTATSNYAVTYNNGTFIAPSRSTSSHSNATTSRTSGVITTDSESLGTSTSILASSYSGTIASPSAGSTASAGTEISGLGGPAVTSSTSPPAATTSSANTSGGGGVVLTPQQQQVVGGVVGGVAGVALVLVALLYFLKWYRQRLKNQGRLPEQLAARHSFEGGEDHALTRRGPMVESNGSSIVPIAAFTSRLKQFRPHSTNTLSSSTTGTSSLPASEGERSFHKVAGRRLPSVLSTGGDGYGGNYGAFDDQTLPGSPPSYGVAPASGNGDSNQPGPRFLPGNDRPISVSEPGTPTMNPFLDPPFRYSDTRSPPSFGSRAMQTSTRDFAQALQVNASRSQQNLAIRGAEGYAALRPSPARTPVTQSPTASSMLLPQPISTPPLMSGDVPELPPIPKLDVVSKGKRGFSTKQNHMDQSPANLEINGSRLSRKSLGRRSASEMSVGGRFKEEI